MFSICADPLCSPQALSTTKSSSPSVFCFWPESCSKTTMWFTSHNTFSLAFIQNLKLSHQNRAYSENIHTTPYPVTVLLQDSVKHRSTAGFCSNGSCYRKEIKRTIRPVVKIIINVWFSWDANISKTCVV